MSVAALLCGCPVESDIATRGVAGAEGDGAAGSTQGTEPGDPESITCGPGTVLRGDQCVVDASETPDPTNGGDGGASVTITCGSGTRLVDGQCVVENETGGSGGSTSVLTTGGSGGAAVAAAGGQAGAGEQVGTTGGEGGTGEALCTATIVDCNGDTSDGCEADLANDAATCGNCDHRCPADHTCITGACVQILAANQNSPRDVAVDGTHVYWTNWGSEDTLGNYQFDGSIVKVPLDGGTPTVLAEAQNRPTSIAIDDANVYWVNSGGDAEILTASKAGGAPVTLAHGVPWQGLEVDETRVYWRETTGSSNVVADAIMSVLKDGTDVTPVIAARGHLMSFALDGGNLYWAEGGPEFSGIMSMPLDGSAEPVSVSTLEMDGFIAVNSNEIFWTDNFQGDEGRVYKVSAAGGEATVLALGPGHNVSELAVDAENVYWLLCNGMDDWDDGKVLRTPKEPGDSEILVDDQMEPTAIAIDDASVYWVNMGSWSVGGLGSVMRISK